MFRIPHKLSFSLKYFLIFVGISCLSLFSHGLLPKQLRLFSSFVTNFYLNFMLVREYMLHNSNPLKFVEVSLWSHFDMFYVHLKRVCILSLLDDILCMSNRSKILSVLFRSSISLLIFVFLKNISSHWERYFEFFLWVPWSSALCILNLSLSAYRFRILMSFWWIDPLITMKSPSNLRMLLEIISTFSEKFSLSNVHKKDWMTYTTR